MAESLRKMQNDLRTNMEQREKDQASTQLVVDTVSKSWNGWPMAISPRRSPRISRPNMPM
jgi:hypothetical protein